MTKSIHNIKLSEDKTVAMVTLIDNEGVKSNITIAQFEPMSYKDVELELRMFNMIGGDHV